MPEIFGAALMGGGSGRAYAAIGAIYPAGATCTCSYGGKTIAAKDTSGRALFLVPSAGQWLVKATNGGQEVEDTVSITTKGQVASVTLAFFTATIAVTYPSGSTCTCSDGTTTLTASDTSGSYTFTVPNTGTWTVTATDGDKTKSITVSITADGQSESVTLSYGFVLFDAGNQYTDITGGWSGTDYTVNTPYCGDNSAGAVSGTKLNCVAKSTAEHNTYSVIGTEKKVAEIANYNTLHVRVTAWANATSGDLETTPKTEFGVSTAKTNINSSRKAVKVVDGPGDDIILDISKVTVSGYLWIYAQSAGNAGNITKIVVDKIWLEE